MTLILPDSSDSTCQWGEGSYDTKMVPWLVESFFAGTQPDAESEQARVECRETRFPVPAEQPLAAEWLASWLVRSAPRTESSIS